MKRLTRRLFLKLSALVASVGGAAAVGGTLGTGCGDEVDECPEGTTRRELPSGYGSYGTYYWGYGSGEPYICD